ncbi:MAG: hypothetical protein HY204_03885 [Nitrospirae bacterium]|nr:hypothetical protein [Nitrospirota bacterium]
MAGKKVWVTWMPMGEKASKPDQVMKALDTYGLQLGGAHWVDDLEKMAWYELGTTLLETGKADLWLIAGTEGDLKSTRNRYALSLVTAMLREVRGPGFPIFCLGLDHAPDAATMPVLTRGFHFLSATDPSWPAKILASFAKQAKTEPWDFRLNATGHPFIGQWFEVGPREGEWQGVMFGVGGEGKISHHLVGPRGQLPEKSILEYPAQGIKAEVKGVEFTAWSVQNKIGSQDSYYVRVDGFPKTVMFGGHPGTDQAEVTVLDLS